MRLFHQYQLRITPLKTLCVQTKAIKQWRGIALDATTRSGMALHMVERSSTSATRLSPPFLGHDTLTQAPACHGEHDHIFYGSYCNSRYAMVMSITT